MEQTPWKPILFAALGSFILLFAVYFLVLPKQDVSQKIDRILEFDASSIAGRKDGKKVWEFSAKSGWVGKDKDATHLKDVESGSFYKDGELLIKHFTAEAVAAYQLSKQAEAQKAAAEIAITGKRSRKKRKFAHITADYFKYDPNKEYSYLSGNIKLIEKKAVLESDSAEIDHDKGIAQLLGNISVKRKDLSLKCGKMRYAADYEEIFAQNNVSAIIKGKKTAWIKADSLKMYIDEEKDVSAKGNIEAIQGKKAVIAEEATYNKNNKTIKLSGKVKTVIQKGSDLIKQETAQKLKDEKIRELLEDQTLQYSNSLNLSTASGDYSAFGNIIVKQKSKEAKAEQADYSDKDETITLTGNVSLKEKERWVKCQKVIVSVKDKTFEAVGKVEAEFKI